MSLRQRHHTKFYSNVGDKLAKTVSRILAQVGAGQGTILSTPVVIVHVALGSDLMKLNFDLGHRVGCPRTITGFTYQRM